MVAGHGIWQNDRRVHSYRRRYPHAWGESQRPTIKECWRTQREFVASDTNHEVAASYDICRELPVTTDARLQLSEADGRFVRAPSNARHGDSTNHGPMETVASHCRQKDDARNEDAPVVKLWEHAHQLAVKRDA